MHYVILDFETTGFEPPEAEIIEIGAVEVKDFEIVRRFHRLVRPKGPIPHVITELTGISPEMVRDESPLSDVIPDLLEFLKDLPIVAHNSKMEQRFLDHYVAPSALLKNFDVQNSIEPLAIILPEHVSHSMESMRKWAGVESQGAHRADNDCEDLYRVLIYAHDFVHTHRPKITKIVGERLSISGWWWSWFFKSELTQSALSSEELTTDLEDAPYFGDLKDLRAEDAAKEIVWAHKIEESQIHSIYKSRGMELGLQYRHTQEEMAQTIRKALTKGERVGIEAPTGTGKSIGYLVPGVLAAEATGVPLVVSTHSKTLQDQLLEKDIPIVAQLLGRSEIRATVVKGQENYLCLRKLHDMIESIPPFEDGHIEERWCYAYLLAFATVSHKVELDRVSRYLRTAFPYLGFLIDQVRSHHTTTIGPKCPYYKRCHFFNSARLAHQSDVVISNHALAFHWPAHFPQIRNIVFDEAHHLEDQITEAFTVSLAEKTLNNQVHRFARRETSKRAGDLQAIAHLYDRLSLPQKIASNDHKRELENLAEGIRSRMTHVQMIVPLGVDRSRGVSAFEEIIDLSKKNLPGKDEILEAFKNLRASIKDLEEYLEAGREACDAKDLKTELGADLLQNACVAFQGYGKALDALLDETQTNFVRLIYWDERERTWRIEVAPIDVSSLTDTLFETKSSIVLTSATLSSGSQPDFTFKRIGLKASAPLLCLPSPFNLAQQATAFVPKDIPLPGTPQHLDLLIEFTEQVARKLQGRTLLLITSNQRLRMAASALRERLKPLGISVFDSLSDSRAVEAFKNTEKAILIGSERYGEGLDIPGRTLSCVIIEKINEAMTRGPLAEARKARTDFGLYDYDFPLRMIWLKQRVGRLIRSTNDTGSVIIFDPRYHAWSQGSRGQVDRALAPMPVRGGARVDILSQLV